MIPVGAWARLPVCSCASQALSHVTGELLNALGARCQCRVMGDCWWAVAEGCQGKAAVGVRIEALVVYRQGWPHVLYQSGTGPQAVRAQSRWACTLVGPGR